ncbi:MAG: sensor histidine kinase [Anaerolineales bacterium]|nr:sensor histidine kinase [Anaerolineales bacterium]
MKISSPPKVNLLTAIALITILGVAVPTLLTIGPLLERWLALILLVNFGGLTTMLPGSKEETAPTKIYLILGLQSVMLLALLLLFPQVDELLTLFYILSIEAMLYFPVKAGLIWLFGCIAAVVVYQINQYGFLDSLVSLISIVGGMLLFSLVSAALRAAQQAQLRSERLLGELQAANRQLQEYADQVEISSVQSERNRLAREMHDTLGHHLTVAAVQLEAARKLIFTDPERTAGILVTTHRQIREALNELRQTVGRLREPLEADLRLDHALLRLVDSFRQSSQLVIQLELPDDGLVLPDTHRLVIYRTAQEGLTNIQRHAAATQVWLRLKRLHASVQFEIEDNGRGLPNGFNINNLTSSANFGLRGIHERLDQLGGQMEVETRSEGGTRLCVSLPLPQEKSND